MLKVEPSCFPCSLARILATAARISDDPWLHHKLLDKAMSELSGIDRDLTPAEMMNQLETLIAKTLGTADPYQKERAEWRQELDGAVERLEELVANADDPLGKALAIAARANVFDDECLPKTAIKKELRRTGVWDAKNAHEEEFFVDDGDLFRQDLAKSETLLFLHDSGPELPFDAVLLRRLVDARPSLRITSVVRAQPVLLDATHQDLDEYGVLSLPGVIGSIDPGISALGIPLSECSREFREAFDAADIILGKGQAHFETLEDCGKQAYFLMRVKCGVMSKAQGAKIGDLLFQKP